MDYKNVLNNAVDISKELAGKAINLYNEGKKVVDEKVAELKDRAEQISIEIDVAKEGVDKDHEINAGRVGEFAYAYALSYRFYNEDADLDVCEIRKDMMKLVSDYNDAIDGGEVIGFDTYVNDKAENNLLKQIASAYMNVYKGKSTSKFKKYAPDLEGDTADMTYANYDTMLNYLDISGENYYLLSELAMEIIKYCFKHKNGAAMTDVINVLRGKQLKAEDGTKIDFGADLERCLDSKKVINLFLAILRVEYKDTYLVNIKNL